MKKKLRVLCLMLFALTFLLCACARDGGAPKETAAPTPTLAPGLEKGTKDLVTQVLACSAQAESLSLQAKNALGQVTVLSVPGQITRAVADAASRQESLALQDGWYSFTESTGGLYYFDKPLAAVMGKESADTYVISEIGEPLETQDAAFREPFDYVMSGLGGGEFVYASYYLIRQDGKCAETETVSRLNDDISGWSKDAYLYDNGTLWFADIQLVPQVQSGEAAQVTGYQWRVCAGRAADRDVLVREFEVNTAELALPDLFPDIRSGGSAAVQRLMDRTDALSTLEFKNGSFTLK